MKENKDEEFSNFTACIIAFVVTVLVLAVIWPDKNIPSEEQKPQVQKVKTEVLTHVIRCTTFVNDTCTEYKVFNVVRE